MKFITQFARCSIRPLHIYSIFLRHIDAKLDTKNKVYNFTYDKLPDGIVLTVLIDNEPKDIFVKLGSQTFFYMPALNCNYRIRLSLNGEAITFDKNLFCRRFFAVMAIYILPLLIIILSFHLFYKDFTLTKLIEFTKKYS